MGGNMNILLGLGLLAFLRHNDILIVGHRCVLRSADSAKRRIVDSFLPQRFVASEGVWPSDRFRDNVLLRVFLRGF